jgi:hypothetical protein
MYMWGSAMLRVKENVSELKEKADSWDAGHFLFYPQQILRRLRTDPTAIFAPAPDASTGTCARIAN